MKKFRKTVKRDLYFLPKSCIILVRWWIVVESRVKNHRKGEPDLC